MMYFINLVLIDIHDVNRSWVLISVIYYSVCFSTSVYCGIFLVTRMKIGKLNTHSNFLHIFVFILSVTV